MSYRCQGCRKPLPTLEKWREHTAGCVRFIAARDGRTIGKRDSGLRRPDAFTIRKDRRA